MSILILAAELDITADRMVSVLKQREVPFARVDTAWFPQEANLDAEFRDGRWKGSLTAAGRKITLEGLRSVWYRSPSTFRFPDELSATERHWAMGEAKLGLGGVLSSLPVRWVNHANRNADAAYKPRQLVVAAQCGLVVPDTLVTNRAEAVRRFAEQASLTVTMTPGTAATHPTRTTTQRETATVIHEWELQCAEGVENGGSA